MSDRISRIYIDSTYKTVASASNGDFRIDLVYPVDVEAGSQISIQGLMLSHVWDVIDPRNNDLFLREVFGNVAYHRVISLETGQYNLGTLAFELERQFNLNTHITDGQWSVTSDARGRFTFYQSSPTFASARIYSAADVRGLRPVPINWQFENGAFVSNSQEWRMTWAAADVVDSLPYPGDACSVIGLPYRRLDFTPAFPEQVSDHADLARHRVLHLCSRELPQSSQTPHGRGDVVASLVCAGATPGSIVHNSHSNPTMLHCHARMELQHLSFQVRDQADEIVDLSGHAVTFEICIQRPYE
jgi:hypothetical protein